MPTNAFQALADLQVAISNLNMIMRGGESDSVVLDGVSVPSVRKSIADAHGELSAMIDGQIPFETLALAYGAGTPPVDADGFHKLIRVLNDSNTENNGIYYWSDGVFVKSPYNPSADSESLGAVARQAAQGTTRRMSWQFRNLFNKDDLDITENAIVNKNDGTLFAVNNYKSTDYIPVDGGQTIICTHDLGFPGNSNYGVAFYNGNYQYLSGLSGASGPVPAGTAMATPSDAAFVRICRNQSGFDNIHLCYGDVLPTEYRSFSLVDNNSLQIEIGSRFSAEMARRNLFRSASLRAGYVNSSGAFVDSTAYTTTGLVRVDEGVSYLVRHILKNNGQTGVAFYDIDGTWISTSTGLTGNIITPPMTACWMEVTFVGGVGGIRAKTQEIYREEAALPGESRSSDMVDERRFVSKSLGLADDVTEFERDFFNEDRCTREQLINASGVFYAASNYSTSNIIQGYPGAVRVPSFATSGTLYVSFFDEHKNWIFNAGGGGNATVAGGNVLTLTSAYSGGDQIRLPPGSPISCSAFPSGTYVVSGPVSGFGDYELSNETTSDVGDTVTWGSSGCLRNVPWTIPRDAHFVAFPMETSSIYWAQVFGKAPEEGDVFIGLRQQLRGGLPCAGDKTIYAGDSIMQSSAAGTKQPPENGVAQYMLQVLTQMDVVQARGQSGAKTREIVGTQAGFDPLDETLVASISRWVEQSGTNSWGVAVGDNQPAKASVVLGELGDQWVPTQFNATLTAGSTDITVTSTTLGDLVHGLPILHAGGNLAVGTTLVDTNGSLSLSAPALTSGTVTIIGGTFYGDLYDVYIRKLLTWNPKLHCIVFGILRRFDSTAAASNKSNASYREGDPINNQGVRLSLFNEAKRAFCVHWGLTFFDTFNECSINSITQVHCLVDKLHPSTLGAVELYVPYLARCINSVPRIGKM
jgi:hypothetical protein